MGSIQFLSGLARITFDPAGAQPFIANFDELAPSLLWRMQREALAEPGKGPLADILEECLSMPTVAEDWRTTDLSVPAAATMLVHLKHGPVDLRFVTMLTVIQAPQTVLLDELRIESWFPHDAATAHFCEEILASKNPSHRK